jgi:hypothetical protein
VASRRKTKKADKKFMKQIMGTGYRLYPGVGGHAAGMTPSQLRAYKKRLAERKNPTKAQKREKTRKASAKRRVAVALAKFLKQANPAGKYAGAKMQRNKGGSITIIPIKLRRSKT